MDYQCMGTMEIKDNLTVVNIVYKISLVNDAPIYYPFKLYNKGVWNDSINAAIFQYCKDESDLILEHQLKGGKIYKG